MKIYNFLLKLKFYFKWIFGLIKEAKTQNRELLFSEEFETIDKTKWNHCFPWGAFNGPNQLNTEYKNIEVNNSIATFWVKPESGIFEDWSGKHVYEITKAHLDTKTLFNYTPIDFPNSRIEVRLKTPSNKNIFPVFWTLSEEHDNSCIEPEIDIVEYVEKRYSMTYHWGTNYSDDHHFDPSSFCSKIDFSKKFYTFAVEINEKYLKWYINNELCKVLKFKKNKMKSPIYLILEVSANSDIDLSELPNGEMQIGWVRVYK